MDREPRPSELQRPELRRARAQGLPEPPGAPEPEAGWNLGAPEPKAGRFFICALEPKAGRDFIGAPKSEAGRGPVGMPEPEVKAGGVCALTVV